MVSYSPESFIPKPIRTKYKINVSLSLWEETPQQNVDGNKTRKEKKRNHTNKDKDMPVTGSSANHWSDFKDLISERYYVQ